MRLDPRLPKGASHEAHDFARPLISLLSMLCTCVTFIFRTYLTSASLDLLSICDISYPHSPCQSPLPLAPRLDRLVVDAFRPVLFFLVFTALIPISFSPFYSFLSTVPCFPTFTDPLLFFFFANLPTTRPCNDLVISRVCFVLIVRNWSPRS